MNNTIALPRLAELLASSAKIDIAESEKFIKAFFAHIEDALAVSENVTVKGLGTFARSSNPETPVVFTIDPELAAAVNQPFDMFEPIAVGDADIPETAVADVPDNTTMPSVEPVANQPVAEIVMDKTTATDRAENADATTSPAPISEPQQAQYYEEYKGIPLEMEESSPRNHTFAWSALAFIIGLILGAVMAYFGHDNLSHLFENDVRETQDTASEQTVTAIAVAIEPVDIEDVANDTVPESKPEQEVSEPKELPQITATAEVYDTVTPNRFLTTMARQYYNQMEYWVFIYEANADKLGNPNRIKPGTVVKIPARSDFEKDADRGQTLNRAKRLAGEIYDRFQ